MGKATASALVDLLGQIGVEPSPDAFDAMCRERGIHPAYAHAYATRGQDGVRDLALAHWISLGDGKVTTIHGDRLDVPFELIGLEEKRQSDGSTVGAFSGMASVFNNVDMVGDVVAPGAFKNSIAYPSKIKMLWQHDSEQPIGVWKGLAETDRGLHAEGHLLLGVQRGQEAHLLLKAGALDGLSIGFRIPKGGAEIDRDTGVRTIAKADLWEVSLVTFPANPKARVSRVKMLNDAGQVPTPRELEAALRDMGFSRRQSRAFLAKGYAGLDPQAVAAETLAGQIRALTASIRSAIP